MSIIDIVVPEEQEGTSAVVRSWLKAVGDTIAVDDPLVELETDKVTQEVPAPMAGVLVEILMNTDDEAVPGDILGRLELNGSTSVQQDGIEPTQAAPITETMTTTETFLSPAVKRALERLDLDPATIQGTGRNGRITIADVENAATAHPAPNSASERPEMPVPAPKRTELPVSARSRAPSSTNVPHSSMRLAIAKNMVNSVTVAPHVTSVFEVDLSAVMAHCAKHKADFEAQGAKLTYTAYFLAACTSAMKTSPAINSRWHDDHLEVFNDLNIGVATSLGDEGLVVPVIHSVQELSLLNIAQRLTDATQRARTNQLSPSDVKGGTFTISNYGVSGALVASPVIINQPQSAILGVGKTEKRVVVREVDGVDSIQIKPMAFVSLTMDHRVVDGHQTNSWLAKFVETLENWRLN